MAHNEPKQDKTRLKQCFGPKVIVFCVCQKVAEINFAEKKICSCLCIYLYVFFFKIEHHDAATFFLYRSPFLPSVGSHSVRAPLFTKKAKTRMKATRKYSHKYVRASLFTNKDIARRIQATYIILSFKICGHKERLQTEPYVHCSSVVGYAEFSVKWRQFQYSSVMGSQYLIIVEFLKRPVRQKISYCNKLYF